MKVPLEKDGSSVVPFIHWTYSKPFVENRQGLLIHRPKHVKLRDPKHWRAFLVVKHWCGSQSCGTDKFTFLDEPPAGKLVCARCEDECIKEGLPTSDELVGRHVHVGGIIGIQRCCLDQP